jgi:hypothetical protein
MIKYLAVLLTINLSACVELQTGGVESVQNSTYLYGQTANGTQVRKLVPLPPNESSEYLVTRTVDWMYTDGEGGLVARFSIVLGPNRELPAGAYLEVQFENPVDPNKPISIALSRGADLNMAPFEAYSGTNVGDLKSPDSFWISGSRLGGEKLIGITSPETKGIKCKNYKIIINVYNDSSKARLLGVHKQMILSSIDTNIVKSTGVIQAVLTRHVESCRFPDE